MDSLLIAFEIDARKKPKLDHDDIENSGQSINRFNTQHAATHTAANFNFTCCSSITINHLKN